MISGKDVRILKIKPWQIKFRIEDRIYILHEQGDTYEPSTVLYRVHTDENGRYELEHLGGILGSFHFSKIYPEFLQHGQTYSYLDGEKILGWLASRGLSPEMDREEMAHFERIDRRNTLQDMLMRELKVVEAIRSELELLK